MNKWCLGRSSRHEGEHRGGPGHKDSGWMADWGIRESVQGNRKTGAERLTEVVKSLANEPNERLRADEGMLSK